MEKTHDEKVGKNENNCGQRKMNDRAAATEDIFAADATK